ncbi:MAG TPA: PadR family transcriptional regulator [Anaerolineales bacterium]|jgi:DNA-binding PadR family transcriptional regulator
MKSSGGLSPEYALLGFLYEKPDHGYDLHQNFQRELGHVWHISQSQAYAVLSRLEQKGYVAIRESDRKAAHTKQTLAITALGRRQFRKWLETPSKSKARVIRMEFLTRLYFARSYRPEKVPAIYETQLAEIQSSIARLENLKDSLPVEQTFNRLSLILRIRQLRLVQEWITEIQHAIRTTQQAT